MRALSINLREAAQALLTVLKAGRHPRLMNTREIMDAITSASPVMVADVLASSLNLSTAQKQVCDLYRWEGMACARLVACMYQVYSYLSTVKA